MKLLLVDDHQVVREALHTWLQARIPGVDIVEAASLGDALQRLEAGAVDLVLLDLHLSDADGVEALAAVLQRFPATKVVVLSGDKDPRVVKAALDLGAKSFVLKDIGTDELLRAIEISLDEGSYLPKEVLSILEGAAPVLEGVDELTPREKDVLDLILKGKSNKLIARELAPITESTVKTHAGRIFRKLKVRTRSEVLALALDRGLKGQTG